MVAGRRHAVEVIERAHERADTGVDCGLERREENRAERVFRHVDAVVVAAGFGGAICHPMLRAGDHFVGAAVVVSLEATHASGGHRRTEERILSGPFGNAPPPGVSRDVHHRRERPVHSGGTRFGSGDRRGSFSGCRIPAGGFTKGDREYRPVAVDDVEGEDQRDLEPRPFHRGALQGVDLRRAAHVQRRAEESLPRQLQVLVAKAAVGMPVELLELPELLFERHL